MTGIIGKISNLTRHKDKLGLLYSRFIIPLKHKKLEQDINKSGFVYGVKHAPVIVSLTSYPKRFPTLPVTLKSLLLQSHKPDKIVVYLDCDKTELTDELLSIQRYGVTFAFVAENLKPHLKYFFRCKNIRKAS